MISEHRLNLTAFKVVSEHRLKGSSYFKSTLIVNIGDYYVVY